MNRAPGSPRRQRGVALITAMLIVALAVVLATQIGFDSVVEQQRTTTMLTLDSGFQVGLGAEAWAAYFLEKDATDDSARGTGTNNSATDNFAENWAKPMPPIPIEGGQIEGGLEDLQGRFNLNNLLTDDPTAPEETQRWLTTFRNLLIALQLDPKWAEIVRDWLDSDNQTRSADGAEDDTYTALTPPYRAANTVITSVSELLALPDFGLENYLKLKPYVTALPLDTSSKGTKINVCTAPILLINALGPPSSQAFGSNAEEMARARKEGCFPRLDTLRNIAELQNAQEMITEQTAYFRLHTFVTIGGTEMSLYSLLYRDKSRGGKSKVLMRSFGAE